MPCRPRLLFCFTIALLISGCEESGSSFGSAVGQKLPEVQAVGWLNAEPSAEELTGRPILVEAWATYCGPCRPKLRETNALFERYSDRVTFVALTSESTDELESIKAVRDNLGLTLPIGYGANDTLVKLDARYVPSAWLANSEGKIVWTYPSADDQPLETAIEIMLRLEAKKSE